MAVKKIGELLVESALISQEQLDEALKSGKSNKGMRLGAILVQKGYASEIDIAQTLSFQLNIPFVDLASATVEPEAVKSLNEQLAKKYQVIPIIKDKKSLQVAMSDPLNLTAIDDMRFSTGKEIRPCVATLSDIVVAINRHYHLNEPIEELMVDLKKDRVVEVLQDADSNRDISEQVKKSAAPPIIKMVDSIIIHGIEKNASDIHIEPQEKGVKLRIRVDGLMKEAMQMPKWVQGPVVSRIKIMAKMDIAERRVSQDGRIKVRLGEQHIDIRVSTLPTQYGETVVMRLLDPKAALLDIDGLGMRDEDREKVLDMIERPQGVVLVTGPTGSGKTSTLYAMIRHIKSERINIITIEDPIEYELKGVNQVAVNEKTGLTFSYTLRSVLRQDPDVILVGEMRDTETSIIAHQASMTGHMVFSTLHTNDAVSSIIRLKNMGVPSYILASALDGVVAQRLVRKICPHCRQEYTPNPAALKRAGISRLGKNRLFRGAGCEQCSQSGYLGRTGIFEVLSVNNKMKGLISTDAHEQELVQAALRTGMTPMHLDGMKKVTSGVTTLEELTRVIYLSRDDDHEDGVCPGCMKEIVAGCEVCPHCGRFVAKECPSCGRARQHDWIVCPFCTAKFESGKTIYS